MKVPQQIGIGLGASLICTVLAYSLGLPGAFIFDDWPNLLDNTRIRVDSLAWEQWRAALLSGMAGPLMRPVSMLSFAANYYFSGYDPLAFKLTNLGIHLVNGVLIFMLARLLLINHASLHKPAKLPEPRLDWIALAVAAAWLVHPINLTSVLYVVQRMNSLATLFVLAGLVCYGLGRTRQLRGGRGWHWQAIAIGFFLPLAALSKESGVLLLPLMLVIEVGVFRFRCTHSATRKGLIGVFVVTLLLPALFILYHIAIEPSRITGGYIARHFTLSERLLTEARVIWFYLRLLLLPAPTDMGLFHDDFTLSTGLFAPPSTALAIAGVVGLTMVAATIVFRPTILGLGIAFFLTGHVLESTAIPLELVFEHRNYLPGFGILLAAFYYLLYPRRFASTQRLRDTSAPIFIALLAGLLCLRATAWADPVLHNLEAARHNPNSARAHTNVGRDYVIAASKSENPATRAELIESGLFHCRRAEDVSARDVEGLFCAIILEHMRGNVAAASYERLEKRLSTGQPYPAFPDWITMLVKNREEAPFNLPTQRVVGIINAALSNSRLTGRDRGAILTQAGGYAINALNNREVALEFARQAVAIDPDNAQYRLNLGKLHRYLGNLKLAGKQLDKAAEYDRLGLLADEIRVARREIDQNNQQQRDAAIPPVSPENTQ